MSEVFYDYAQYYDLLYKNKNYVGEAAYIHALIQKYKLGARTILNLGCGTGKHDACLVKLGYQVTGVDLSETMLAQAKTRAIPGQLEFCKGDVRSVDLGRQFDVVVSLFHVISYQTNDQDILAAFRTANKHLKDGGVFLFDFWHGGGVCQDPPVTRVKRLEDEEVKIIRIAEPVMHSERQIIDVNYEILTIDKKSARCSELREMHAMRYLFLPEIEQAFAKTGFLLKQAGAWMSDKPLASAWYGLVVAQKKDGL